MHRSLIPLCWPIAGCCLCLQANGQASAPKQPAPPNEHASSQTDKDREGLAAVEALTHKLDASLMAFLAKPEAAKTDAARHEIFENEYPRPETMGPLYLELAEKYAGTEGAALALAEAFEFPEGDRNAIFDTLIEQHLESKYVGRVCKGLGSTHLASRMQEENISWRSFWNGSDGTQGPISRAWNITAWPTLYILDPEGRIRFKGLRNQELDQAVDRLLAEMKEGRPAPDPADGEDGNQVTDQPAETTTSRRTRHTGKRTAPGTTGNPKRGETNGSEHETTAQSKPTPLSPRSRSTAPKSSPPCHPRRG